MPFFTIITPTYNRAYTLDKAFSSLQNQNFNDFEWIIGDDGSIDGTETLVNSFIKKAKFTIKYYKLPHGGKHNVLKAIKDYPQGSWILGLDSDDVFYNENTLSEMKSTIDELPKDKNYYAIAGCFVNQHNEKTPKLDEQYIDMDISRYLHFLTSDAKKINCCWIAKREYWIEEISCIPNILDNLPFYPEICILTNSRLKHQNCYYRLCNKPWYRYNMYNDDSISCMKIYNLTVWYEIVDMLNIFNKYNISDQYDKFIKAKLNILGNKLYKLKGFKTTLDSLKRDYDKNYFRYVFFVRRFFKYIFFIDKGISKTKYYLLGIKIYNRKAESTYDELL